MTSLVKIEFIQMPNVRVIECEVIHDGKIISFLCCGRGFMKPELWIC